MPKRYFQFPLRLNSTLLQPVVFFTNSWAPALIAIGSTAVLVGTGIFVYKFFIQKGDKVMPANTPRNVDHPRAQSSKKELSSNI